MGQARIRNAAQLAAMKRQLELEEQAAAEKAIQQQAWLDSLPPDLRLLYHRGLGFHGCADLVRRGRFEHDTAEQVQRAVVFLIDAGRDIDVQICQHPRFAEFWPEAAARMEAEKRARKGPVLLGADGAPLAPSAPIAAEPRPDPEPLLDVPQPPEVRA